MKPASANLEATGVGVAHARDGQLMTLSFYQADQIVYRLNVDLRTARMMQIALSTMKVLEEVDLDVDVEKR